MPYNEKSKGNLKPFTGKNDPRRQNGRKKGQLNRRTVLREFLSQNIDPHLLIDEKIKNRSSSLRGKTYMEAILHTLANQALGGNTRASDVLLRELRQADREDPPKTEFYQPHHLKIEVVESRERYDQLLEAEKKLEETEMRLEAKYGDNYEYLLDD